MKATNFKSPVMLYYAPYYLSIPIRGLMRKTENWLENKIPFRDYDGNLPDNEMFHYNFESKSFSSFEIFARIKIFYIS